FEKLGVAAQVKPKIILAPNSGASTENVATGKAEFVITLFSEIVPVKGIEVLGPLPGEYATYVNFTAAASSGAPNLDAAKKFFAFMSGPKTAPVLAHLPPPPGMPRVTVMRAAASASPVRTRSWANPSLGKSEEGGT